MFDACSGAVLANLDQNSILTVEDDLADSFGSLVLDNIDLNDLILRLEVVGLHLVMERALSNDIVVSHFKSQSSDLLYTVPLHFRYALIGIPIKCV